MHERQLIRFGLNGIAGFLSFAVMGYGLYSAIRIDVRYDPVPSMLYYILPTASFPVFVFGLVWRKAAIVQTVIALAYVVVCVILSWRECTVLGYCTSVTHAVVLNLETQPVLAFLATAVASSIAMLLRDERTKARSSEKLTS